MQTIDGKEMYNYMYTLHFVDCGEEYRGSLEQNNDIRCIGKLKKKEKKKIKEGI